jgi:hypothetical protein
MTKEPRTREQLAEMVLKEARATGKCADLHSVIVLGPVAQGRSNWHMGSRTAWSKHPRRAVGEPFSVQQSPHKYGFRSPAVLGRFFHCGKTLHPLSLYRGAPANPLTFTAPGRCLWRGRARCGRQRFTDEGVNAKVENQAAVQIDALSVRDRT